GDTVAIVVADQHRTGLAGKDNGAIGEHDTIIDGTGHASADFSPGVAGITRCKHLSLHAVHQHQVIGHCHAEEGTAIRAFQFLPADAIVARAQQRALLAGHQQCGGIRDSANGIQVPTIRILHVGITLLPGGATILCLDDIAVTTYSDYALAAFAVHIEEWRAGGIDRGGGFIKVLVAVVIIIVVVIVVRLFFGVIVLFVSCTSERVGLLLRPGLASVFSRQHDGIVPNRPA